MTLPHVTLDDVRDAAARIEPFAHRTPIVTSRTLDDDLDASVLFKCENLQKVGAFKARGALNAVMSLEDGEAALGVVTHSSGNHGAALAYAASQRGIPCVVVMPRNASEVKVDAIRMYGADIVFCSQRDRENVATRVQVERGAMMVHPYNDAAVIAGQGTAALEFLEESPTLDMIVTPVGGGGLLSGTSVTVRSLRTTIEIVGAEPANVDDAARSLATGVLQPGPENPHTVADGLLTGLGDLTFDILAAAGARIVTVTEDSILAAALFHLQRMKLVVEPSAATALAALRTIAPTLRGRTIGVIISGGNTDFGWLRDQVLERPG